LYEFAPGALAIVLVGYAEALVFRGFPQSGSIDRWSRLSRCAMTRRAAEIKAKPRPHIE
jgi:membrane protease YdiL (CAAX protease family)